MKAMRIEMEVSSCFQFRKIINELTYFASKFNQVLSTYSRVNNIRGHRGISPFCRIPDPSIQLTRLRESRKWQGNRYSAGFRTGYLRHVYPDNLKLARRNLKLIAFHQLIAGNVQKVRNVVRSAVL
jgi:hypothetical protein